MKFVCLAVTGEFRRPTTYVFQQDEITLGRSSSSDIRFDPMNDGVVSRHHAVIRIRDGRVYFEYKQSTQGSYVEDDQKISGEIKVVSGMTITLGKEGPRVHFMFDSEDDTSVQSPALIRSHNPIYFPLSLYGKFPTTFQEYQKIGEGGYGQVWIGRKRGGSTWTAIKFLRPELLTPGDDSQSVVRVEKTLERFKREFQIMKQLAQNREKGMIKIYKIGSELDLGFVYMTMEYIKGNSLDKIIMSKRELGEEKICRYLYQLSVSMDYFHNHTWYDPEKGKKMKGIVHRDVKPSNILIREKNDRAYLCDFGIAGIEEGGTRLTLPKMRVFTSKYSAPEVIRMNHITPASDLWGLAVVAYILFSGGYFPYAGNGLKETLESIENNEITPLKRFNPDVNSVIRNFIERALNPDPKVRPQTAREWMEMLSMYAPGVMTSISNEMSEEAISRASQAEGGSREITAPD